MGAAGRRRPTSLRDLRVTLPVSGARPPAPPRDRPGRTRANCTNARPARRPAARSAPRLGTGAAVISLLYGWTPAGALPPGRSSVTDSVTESIFAREKKIGK